MSAPSIAAEFRMEGIIDTEPIDVQLRVEEHPTDGGALLVITTDGENTRWLITVGEDAGAFLAGSLAAACGVVL